jgi:hypothetical protein
MIYRPHFPYATPIGCRDLDFTYYFDGSNTPQLNQNVSGLEIPNIPLTLEQDAPFMWRGFKVNADRELSGGTAPDTYVAPNWQVRFEDWAFNKLQDDYIAAVLTGFPQNPWSINRAKLTGPPVPFPCEIYCPPGSVQWFFLKAGSLSGGDSHFASVCLYGVKRYKECE